MKMQKRGQVTMWVILAIFIVASVLIYLAIDKKPQQQQVINENPKDFIYSCLKKPVEESADNIARQGGYIDASSAKEYLKFNNNNVAFLCYTNKEEENCLNLEPVIITHLENEIKKDILDDVDFCFKSLEKNMLSNGFDYVSKIGNYSVEIAPEKIKVNIVKNIEISKEQDKQSYEQFALEYNNPIYKFATLSNKIINEEVNSDCSSTNGNADIIKIQRNNKDVEIERFITGRNEKIYTLREPETEKEFIFAVYNCFRLP